MLADAARALAALALVALPGYAWASALLRAHPVWLRAAAGVPIGAALLVLVVFALAKAGLPVVAPLPLWAIAAALAAAGWGAARWWPRRSDAPLL